MTYEDVIISKRSINTNFYRWARKKNKIIINKQNGRAWCAILYRVGTRYVEPARRFVVIEQTYNRDCYCRRGSA